MVEETPKLPGGGDLFFSGAGWYEEKQQKVGILSKAPVFVFSLGVSWFLGQQDFQKR